MSVAWCDTAPARELSLVIQDLNFLLGRDLEVRPAWIRGASLPQGHPIVAMLARVYQMAMREDATRASKAPSILL